MNKIQVVGTSNDNKVLFDVNLDGNQWRNKNGRIAESNQAGEWDTVYVLIDPAAHKYTLYVNDKNTLQQQPLRIVTEEPVILTPIRVQLW